MTKEQFIGAKTETAKRALPHLVDPDKYGPAGLTPAECAILVSPDEKHMVSTAQFLKQEKSALANLGGKLRSMGVMRAADCFPPRR